MIIEIKDLPEGRKVKHINVDISFEEDGNVKVQTNNNIDFYEMPTTVNYSTASEKDENIEEKVESTESTESVKIEKPVIKERKANKDIPPEMTDMEL